jgi:hypothetical protein
MNKEHHPKTVFETGRKNKREIEKLFENCPEECKCRQRGVDDLCYVRDIGLKSFVQCLEKDSLTCFHRIGFGRNYYCTCPVCVFMAKGFKV